MQSKNGLLLIFKSNLIHGAQQNKSNKQKISLALNFKVL
jgi:ectoine hydroxylase-related dioxygenase (phytanoyl-CoA dioxygenase family)